MLDQIVDLVKQNAGAAILNNPAIPADRKDEAIDAAGTSIAGGLQNILSQGGIKEILGLFSGKALDVTNNPVTEQVTGSFINSMSTKFGLSAPEAGGIASSLVPAVLGQLISKSNDPNDKSVDLQSMLNQFSGGKTSGLNIGSIFNKFKAGLDKDGDGDVDLDDLKQMFSGSSSILDKIKGAF